MTIDPDDPLTWRNKVLALAEPDREEEAMHCFSQYRDLTGNHQLSTRCPSDENERDNVCT